MKRLATETTIGPRCFESRPYRQTFCEDGSGFHGRWRLMRPAAIREVSPWPWWNVAWPRQRQRLVSSPAMDEQSWGLPCKYRLHLVQLAWNLRPGHCSSNKHDTRDICSSLFVSHRLGNCSMQQERGVGPFALASRAQFQSSLGWPVRASGGSHASRNKVKLADQAAVRGFD